MSMDTILNLKLTRIESIEGCRAFKKEFVLNTIAFVPTMGALHEGHFSLIRHAKTLADKVVVSIFVNPTQFGPNEDFNRYPRTLEEDLRACDDLGVDAVFNPSVEEMYPDGQSVLTSVVPPAHLLNQLCALGRPGHFEAVASVVSKLFNIVQPDVAIFGEKDAQQLAVIRQMVCDLNMPVQIVGSPTARNEEGLALSSRNKYLATDDDKQLALCLNKILNIIVSQTQQSLNSTERPMFSTLFDEALLQVLEPLGTLRDKLQLEYLSAVDRQTFQPLAQVSANAKILIAAKLGKVRLIDNMNV